jgi:hypothetical protein
MDSRIIFEDGFFKDSASPYLKHTRATLVPSFRFQLRWIWAKSH